MFSLLKPPQMRAPQFIYRLLRRSSISINTQDKKSNKTQDNKTPVNTK